MKKMDIRSASSNTLPDAMERRKILRMAVQWDDDDIAFFSGLSVAVIREIINAAPVQRWWGRCNTTGQTVIGRGWRAVYRTVCLRGWTDWDWGKGETVGENRQP